MAAGSGIAALVETRAGILTLHAPTASLASPVHHLVQPESARDAVFADRSAVIRARSRGFDSTVLRTSIWDETLYRAWSSVVTALIPHIRALETALADFSSACAADEVVLFERASFLVIAQVTVRPHPDIHRFEKVSNIVKQFKLAVSREAAQFGGMRAGNSTFTVFIESFTSNTYLMVVTSASSAPDEATLHNIAAARGGFDRLIAEI